MLFFCSAIEHEYTQLKGRSRELNLISCLQANTITPVHTAVHQEVFQGPAEVHSQDFLWLHECPEMETFTVN